MRRGRIGGVLAGLGFLLPSLCLILLLSSAYSRLDLTNPALAAILLGVQVGVIALIARALHRIGEHVLVDRRLLLIALVTAVASIFRVPFWISLPAAGSAYALAAASRPWALAVVILTAAVLALLLTPWEQGLAQPRDAIVEVTAGSVGAMALFITGLKGGLLTFGGAYTAIPFIRDDAVGRGWMSEGQFLDGLAWPASSLHR